jgi:hypothetical protein
VTIHLPRPTLLPYAHELLSSLAGIGLPRCAPDSRYRLGWRLLTLSGQLVNSTDVARLGALVLPQLAGRRIDPEPPARMTTRPLLPECLAIFLSPPMESRSGHSMIL